MGGDRLCREAMKTKKKVKRVLGRTAKGKPRFARTEDYLESTGEAAKKGKPNYRFKKGNPGRVKGATDKVLRSWKGSIRDLCQEVAENEHTTLRSAVMRGLTADAKHAHHYLRLVADYVDGRPTDNINLNATWNSDRLEEAAHNLGVKMDRLVTAVLAKKEQAK